MVAFGSDKRSVVPRTEPHPARILLVEDEFLIRAVTGEGLRDAGFTIIEAGNADEAKALLDTGLEVDLVFSDVRMNGSMDGLGFARYVRSEFPELPVVITSASAITASAMRGLGAFVPKPYRTDEIATLITTVLLAPS